MFLRFGDVLILGCMFFLVAGERWIRDIDEGVLFLRDMFHCRKYGNYILLFLYKYKKYFFNN